MKILITTSSLPISNQDKVPAFVKDQALELKKHAPDTDIIIHAPHNSYSDTVYNQKPNKNYHEYRFHYFWPYKWELLTGRGIVPALKQNKLLYIQIPFLVFFQFLSLYRLTRKERPSLIYAHWFTPQAITSALVSRLTNTPFIFTTHASDVEVLKKLPFSKRLVRAVCQQAESFTAVSDRTAKRMKVFFDNTDWEDNFVNKLHIIPMGIDTKPAKLRDPTVRKTLDKYHLASKKINILYLGRLSEIKGIEYLVRAVSLLPSEIRNKSQLIIAGDGQSKDALQKLAASLGVDAVFTGYVHGEDKNALLSGSDIVCIPSIIDSNGHMEGLPIVMMEGLAAGKLVLASDVSGAESIIQDKKSGFIFKQKSAESLCNVIEAAIATPDVDQKRIQRSARELSKRFNWEIIIEDYHKIISKAARP